MRSDRNRRAAVRIIGSAIAAVALGMLSAVAWAQAYPAKRIRLIIPFQPLVAENVPGANGVIGLVRSAKSAPDGYTIAIGALKIFLF